MRILGLKKKHLDKSWQGTLWIIIRLVCYGLVGKVLINVGVSFMLFVVYRGSEPYETLDPLDFQLWKAPSELLLTLQTSLIFVCYLFIST